MKPATWYPIAVVLSVANLMGAVAYAAEPAHAAGHAAIGLAFAYWAYRLRRGSEGSQARRNALEGTSDDVETLRRDLENLRREVGELNERVDFAERLLVRARSPEAIEIRNKPRPPDQGAR